MSTTPQPASVAASSEKRPPCFLCALDGSRCQIPVIEGKLIGARVERREPKQIPVVGLVTADGTRVRLNLGPGAIALVERLAVLPADILQQLHLRALHLVHGKANAPAPGQPPFRVALVLPASLAIIEPDLLLNITDLSHGTYCVRQEVLRDLFPSPPSAAGLRGTLIHNIFKEMLLDPSATPEDVLEDGLRGAVVALAEAGVTEAEVRGDVATHLENLAQWRTRQAEKLRDARVRAETFLLAPEIGLKGRLDILLDGGAQRSLLELKTGRATGDLPKQDHRWQVYGYHALLAARVADRTQARPLATLLYSGTPGVAAGFGIPVALREMQRVIGIRNDLALVRLTGTVPPPPGGNKCARCTMHASCAETSALIGWQPPPGDPPLPTAERDGAWFRHWWSLQRLEGRVAEQQTYALWRQTAAERIRDGLAIGPLDLLAPPAATDRHEWIYTFGCDNTSELREGDEVLLSDGDPVRGEVVSGAIIAIGADRVTLWAREQINRPALIDRYSADVVNRRMQHNLTRWLHVDDHRRALVRGDLRPRFDRDPPPLNPTTMAGLNGEQADAVVRALTMRDYLLIQGPPGTGKTKVIAAIAAALAGRGFRVALAAATNQATDTLLARLVAQGARNVIRLGHELATAPEMRPYRLLAQARARTGEAAPPAEAVRAILRAAPVVAATVATWSAEAHEVDGTMPLFDVVIVDEATQLTLPAALGALRWGRRFILVGDEHQLPPVVQSAAALANGLGVSLFETLLAKAPEEARVVLRRQYRMHAAICAFPSTQFYHGRLVADDAVARATLAITPARHTAILDPAQPVVWVEVGPDGGRAVETAPKGVPPQSPPAWTGSDGPARAKVNEAEAHAAANLAAALVASGLAPEEIGVIAPFRAQVARIRQVAGDLVARGLTIDTVDRFQGGERAAIILSLTAAAPLAVDSPLAPFLGDPRRLNVALTRARHKLIILGHRAAFADQPLLHALAETCDYTAHM
jgi:DNA replication ATP-dependent helicase Dna2